MNRMHKFLILFVSVFCLTATVMAQKKILIYTHNGKGYKHENIPASVEALAKLCVENGYKTEATDDPTVFSADKLKGFSCIIFSNTNNEGDRKSVV